MGSGSAAAKLSMPICIFWGSLSMVRLLLEIDALEGESIQCACERVRRANVMALREIF